ncbi:hypothetical protein HIM_00940 [Hirsutella minnesotensis 3608]|nr:hypothetical protein HIM_00940 [Hirsutella minnesotensis 3608]
MPPPPTDEQIIASFTPEEREIHDWYHEPHIVQEREKHAAESFSWQKWVSRELRPQRRMEAYYSWSDKWLGRFSRRRKYPMSVHKFIRLVIDTRFKDDLSILWLLGQFTSYTTPYITAGTSTFGGMKKTYVIQTTETPYLYPHRDFQFHKEIDGILDREMLVIKYDDVVDDGLGNNPSSYPTLTARKRRRGNRSDNSDNSNSSAETDDAFTGDHMVFLQIGSLHVFEGDETAIEDMRDGKHPEKALQPTNFGVVVEITSRCDLGSVYAIYKFVEQNRDDWDQPNVHVRKYGNNGKCLPCIGRLYDGCKETFTVAKIAEKIEDLRKGERNFHFAVKNRTQECRIARAIRRGVQPQVLSPYSSNASGLLFDAI